MQRQPDRREFSDLCYFFLQMGYDSRFERVLG